MAVGGPLELRPTAGVPGSRGIATAPISRQLLIGAAVAAVGTYSVIQFRNVFLVMALVALIVPWYLGEVDRPRRLFVVGAGVLLIGYAFLGKGFAYVGIPPIFIGEIVLVLGILAFLLTRGTFVYDLPRLLLLAFMAWGAIRTVPYIAEYQFLALRDAVAWGYGALALMIPVLVTRDDLHGGVRRYAALIVPLCIFYMLTVVVPDDLIPVNPISRVPIVGEKAGDSSVHLTGVAAFIIVGLYALTRSKPSEWLVWIMWIPPAIVMAISNRGGMAAMAMTALAFLLTRTPTRIMPPVLIGFAMLLLVLWVDPVFDIGTNRTVSLGQVVENVTSIFGETEDSSLEGTKEFRVRWWGTIIDYTVNGEFFWTGKGFGVNLATDDGFQITGDESLRAPHNGHIEVLARAGVPGLVLWVAFNASWAVTVLRGTLRARRERDAFSAALLAWLLVYWAAMMVNASFDPYLQGPQGGIWYWVVVGSGLLAVDLLRRRDTDGSLSAAASASVPRFGPGRASVTPSSSAPS